MFEGRHSRSPIQDVLAYDAVVATARGLIQQRTVRSCIARRRQVANSASLSHELPAKPLLLVKAVGLLPGERVVRAHGQKAQKQQAAALHFPFLQDSLFFDNSTP